MLVFDPRLIAGAGMLCAIIAGLFPRWREMSSSRRSGCIGERVTRRSMSGPLLFDLGVFLVVIGAVLTIVLALEEEDV